MIRVVSALRQLRDRSVWLLVSALTIGVGLSVRSASGCRVHHVGLKVFVSAAVSVEGWCDVSVGGLIFGRVDGGGDSSRVGSCGSCVIAASGCWCLCLRMQSAFGRW